MRIVTIDSDGCTLLFLLMSENSFRRQHTLSSLGHPVFDTATGNVHYVSFPQNFADEQEFSDMSQGMAEGQSQMLADLKLLPPPVAARLGVVSRFPTRYIEVPAANPHVIFRRSGYSQSERDEIASMVIDWLEKLGDERGIHYQYQIEDLRG